MPRKLLFLCQTYPYPPDGGVWIRSFNILRLLAREFEVTALCFERSIAKAKGFARSVPAGRDPLHEIARVESFEIPQRHSRIRFFTDHLQSVLRGQVFTNYLYNSSSFRVRLHNLLHTESFDIVHVDSLDLSRYMPMITGLPVFCTHHNVESELLERRAAVEANRMVRAYCRIQAGFARAEEKQWCPRVDLNITVSEEDAAKLAEIASGRFLVVPNGVDVSHFKPLPEGGGGIVFVGGTSWFPNRDALSYFSEDILPIIRAHHPAISVKWVGAAREVDRAHFREHHRIELTGYVDDIREAVAQAHCYVVPLRVGGGSRLKILDAWAMGKAVVSTSVGCEGLAAEHGRNILIADTPADFAAAVLRVLTDRHLRLALGEEARATVEHLYAWEAIGKKMMPWYFDAIERRKDAGNKARAQNGNSAFTEVF